MKIFNDILDKHTKICTCKESYKINEFIEITVSQDNNKVIIWGFNHKSDRFVNLGTKRFEKLIDGFKSVASDMYVRNDYYYITLKEQKEVEEKTELELLQESVQKLTLENEQLKEELAKIREYYKFEKDYGNHMIQENNKLRDKLNQCSQNKMNVGRKAKFTDEQIEQIKQARAENKSIRQIAKDFNCSVGLVHKLINEQKDTCNFVLVSYKDVRK